MHKPNPKIIIKVQGEPGVGKSAVMVAIRNALSEFDIGADLQFQGNDNCEFVQQQHSRSMRSVAMKKPEVVIVEETLQRSGYEKKPLPSSDNTATLKTGVLGKVRWFSAEKGYGFVEYEGQDVFVHYSSVLGEGFASLEEGETVTFTLRSGRRRTYAEDVARHWKGCDGDGTYCIICNDATTMGCSGCSSAHPNHKKEETDPLKDWYENTNPDVCAYCLDQGCGYCGGGHAGPVT